MIEIIIKPQHHFNPSHPKHSPTRGRRQHGLTDVKGHMPGRHISNNMLASPPWIVRVRTPDQCVRIPTHPDATWAEFKLAAATALGLGADAAALELSQDPSGRVPIHVADTDSVGCSALGHGCMIYCPFRKGSRSDGRDPEDGVRADTSLDTSAKGEICNGARPPPVVCDHPTAMRCSQCTGREPTTLPGAEAAYKRYRLVFKGVAVSDGIRTARGDLRYGEVDFWAFAALLQDVGPQPGEVFCDIGAGVGRAVVAARLLFPDLRLAFGIELQGELAAALAAVTTNSGLDTGVGLMGCAQADLRQDRCELTLSNGETWHNWPVYAESDIVFVASTAFSDGLMRELSARVRGVKRGSRVITLTKPLVAWEGSFRLTFCRPYRFGWGSNATVYCWERL